MRTGSTMAATDPPHKPGALRNELTRRGVWMGTLVLFAAALTWAPLPAEGARKKVRDQTLRNGQAALEDGLYNLAAKHFRDYIGMSRAGEEKAVGTLFLAETLFNQDEQQAVIDLLAEHAEWSVGTPSEGGFVFWAARAHLALGLLESALERLNDFETRFPDDPYLIPADRLRIRCLLKKEEMEQALSAFAAFDRRHRGDESAPENLIEWAGTLVELDDAEKAGIVLERLLKDYPESEHVHQARLWLGEIFAERGDTERARLRLNELADTESAPGDLRADSMVRLARIYEGETNYPAALRVLTGAAELAREPQTKYRLTLALGVDLVRMDQLEEGLAVFRESVVLLTNRSIAAEAQLELADVLLQRDLNDEAGEAFQHYLEAFSDELGHADALMGKAWSLWNRQRFPEAATSFEKAYAVYEEPEAKQTALFKAGDAYFANEQFSSAKPHYEKLASDFPLGSLAPRARLQVAECLAGLDETEGAREAFAELAASGENPIAEQAALRLAMLSEQEGAWQDAVASYDRVLQEFPEGRYRADALHRRGLTLYRTGQFEEALADFRRVVADHPDSEVSEQAFFMRGYSHYLMGESTEALAVCKEFVERYPESTWAPDVLFWLGEYFWNEREYAEAEPRFVMLAEKHPDADLADDALYWAGQAAVAQMEYRRAVDHFTALSKAYPNSNMIAETRFAQGDALSERGEFSLAILTFEEIAKNFPDSYLADRAQGRIGDCQFTLGPEDPERYEKALTAYRTIRDKPSAAVDLQMQAEYKMGRCHEKMGDEDAAFEAYMNVVYRYFAEWENGRRVDPLWFTRAAFSAAGIQESHGNWEEAVRIYERVIEAGVPAALDGQQQIQKIMLEHWLPFLRDTASQGE